MNQIDYKSDYAHLLNQNFFYKEYFQTTGEGLLFGLFGLFLLIYFFYLWIDRFLDKKRSLYYLKVKFNLPKLEEKGQAFEDMQGFFASIHSLLASERISLEIHKSTQYLDLVLASPSKVVLNCAKNFLTGLKTVSIEQTEANPLPQGQIKYQKEVFLTKDYALIDYTNSKLFSKLVNFLTSLEDAQTVSIFFNLRATFKQSKILSKIHQKELLLAKNKGNLKHTLTNEIEELEKKSSYSNFFEQNNYKLQYQRAF
jgi:hypothetical protein